ncbi:unnamed protein product [Leptosia nina]|uniref:Uncharacterized protein n=1 Tax=Leptosia nina TaxID=320188 RepID=A0AAV1JJ21_9NEOP
MTQPLDKVHPQVKEVPNMICLFILLTVAKSQELPASDRQSNLIRQYLEEISPEPTKKGPVLFPNDGPPPPRPPLVVTSRPLTEAIARSELNNSVADSSYINPVTYRPNYGSYNNFEIGARPSPEQYRNDVSREQDYSENQNYAFSYVVKDQKNGDDFSHKQQSVGSATNGEYRVRLPDGRVQIVSYTADDNGYNAKVRYDDDQTDFNLNKYGSDDYINRANYNTNNDYRDNNNLNSYDFGKVNYRDEIPVKEHEYDSKEYYDYSAENFKSPQLYNPVSTANPLLATTIAPYINQRYQTTPYQFYQTQPPTKATLLQNYQTIAPLQQNFPLSKSEFSQNYRSLQLDAYTTPFPVSTVRPSYDDIKHLFTTPNYNNVEINSPSSYSDNVVYIGAKNPNSLHTFNGDNISTTPSSYIASSLNNLNDRINTKPVLSNGFLERINKYLSFK